MSNSLISVIIPVYNVEAYLSRCLRSVINNTYNNLEIICVNDGSTDNCQVILEQYAAKDSRIKVIEQENQGLSAARNKGMNAALGDWFYLLDSDDWIHQKTFEYLLQAAEISKADIIVGGFKRVSSDEQFSNVTSYDIPEEFVVFSTDDAINTSGRMRDSVWGTLYHRDIAEKYRFPEGIRAFGEDGFFNTLIYSNEKDVKYAFVNFPLYAYFNAPGSIMNTMSPDKMLRAIKYWVEHLHEFERPQYAVKWVILQLFHYGRFGKNCLNPYTAKTNIRFVHKLCQPYMWACTKLPPEADY